MRSSASSSTDALALEGEDRDVPEDRKGDEVGVIEAVISAETRR